MSEWNRKRSLTWYVASANSDIGRQGMAATHVLLLVLLVTATSQKQLKQTRGNECRYACIMSHSTTTSLRSTHCTVPVKPKLRTEVTVAATLDSESQWILKHNGFINGQIVYFDNATDNQAVWTLSQKSCLAYGDARGFPVSAIFQNVSTGPGSAKPSLIGDWSANSEGGIFRACVEHTTPWRQGLLKTTASEHGSRVPPVANQYMRVHDGNNEGLGDQLEHHEFSYVNIDLEDVFQRALNEAESKNSTIPEGKPVVRSGMPVLMRGYSFKNGLSIINAESVNSSQPRPDLVPDFDAFAWNRLPEAVVSLSAGPAPTVLLPEAIKRGEMVSPTVAALTSFVAFFISLKMVQNASR